MQFHPSILVMITYYYTNAGEHLECDVRWTVQTDRIVNQEPMIVFEALDVSECVGYCHTGVMCQIVVYDISTHQCYVYEHYEVRTQMVLHPNMYLFQWYCENGTLYRLN